MAFSSRKNRRGSSIVAKPKGRLPWFPFFKATAEAVMPSIDNTHQEVSDVVHHEEQRSSSSSFYPLFTNGATNSLNDEQQDVLAALATLALTISQQEEEGEEQQRQTNDGNISANQAEVQSNIMMLDAYYETVMSDERQEIPTVKEALPSVTGYGDDEDSTSSMTMEEARIEIDDIVEEMKNIDMEGNEEVVPQDQLLEEESKLKTYLELVQAYEAIAPKHEVRSLLHSEEQRIITSIMEDVVHQDQHSEEESTLETYIELVEAYGEIAPKEEVRSLLDSEEQRIVTSIITSLAEDVMHQDQEEQPSEENEIEKYIELAEAYKSIAPEEEVSSLLQSEEIRIVTSLAEEDDIDELATIVYDEKQQMLEKVQQAEIASSMNDDQSPSPQQDILEKADQLPSKDTEPKHVELVNAYEEAIAQKQEEISSLTDLEAQLELDIETTLTAQSTVPLPEMKSTTKEAEQNEQIMTTAENEEEGKEPIQEPQPMTMVMDETKEEASVAMQEDTTAEDTSHEERPLPGMYFLTPKNEEAIESTRAAVEQSIDDNRNDKDDIDSNENIELATTPVLNSYKDESSISAVDEEEDINISDIVIGTEEEEEPQNEIKNDESDVPLPLPGVELRSNEERRGIDKGLHKNRIG